MGRCLPGCRRNRVRRMRRSGAADCEDRMCRGRLPFVWRDRTRNPVGNPLNECKRVLGRIPEGIPKLTPELRQDIHDPPQMRQSATRHCEAWQVAAISLRCPVERMVHGAPLLYEISARSPRFLPNPQHPSVLPRSGFMQLRMRGGVHCSKGVPDRLRGFAGGETSGWRPFVGVY